MSLLRNLCLFAIFASPLSLFAQSISVPLDQGVDDVYGEDISVMESVETYPEKIRVSQPTVSSSITESVQKLPGAMITEFSGPGSQSAVISPISTGSGGTLLTVDGVPVQAPFGRGNDLVFFPPSFFGAVEWYGPFQPFSQGLTSPGGRIDLITDGATRPGQTKYKTSVLSGTANTYQISGLVSQRSKSTGWTLGATGFRTDGKFNYKDAFTGKQEIRQDNDNRYVAAIGKVDTKLSSVVKLSGTVISQTGYRTDPSMVKVTERIPAMPGGAKHETFFGLVSGKLNIAKGPIENSEQNVLVSAAFTHNGYSGVPNMVRPSRAGARSAGRPGGHGGHGGHGANPHGGGRPPHAMPHGGGHPPHHHGRGHGMPPGVAGYGASGRPSAQSTQSIPTRDGSENSSNFFTAYQLKGTEEHQSILVQVDSLWESVQAYYPVDETRNFVGSTLAYDGFEVLPKTYLIPRVRGQYEENLGSALDGGLTAIYEINSENELFASSSYLNKAPSMIALYGYLEAGRPILGNEDLPWEKIQISSLGYNYTGKKIGVWTSAWYASHQDLGLRSTTSRGQGLFEQVGNAQTYGLTANVNYDISRKVSFRVSGLLQEADNLDKGKKLTFKPPYILGAGVSYQVIPEISLGVENNYLGARFYSSSNSLGADPINRTNLRGDFRLGPTVAYLKVSNIFDAEGYDNLGYPSPGMSLWAGLSVDSDIL